MCFLYTTNNLENKNGVYYTRTSYLPLFIYHNFWLSNMVKIITSNARNFSLIIEKSNAYFKNIATNKHINWGVYISYLQNNQVAKYLKINIYNNPSLSF